MNRPAVTTSLTRTAPAAPGRRRSGLAVAAALLMMLVALFVLIDDIREHGVRAGPATLCLLLGAAAIGLVWGGRAGYWFGLVMAAILAAFVALAVAGVGWDAGTVVAAAIGLAPLVLLLLPPAARGPLRQDAAGRPDADVRPAPPGAEADGALEEAVPGGTTPDLAWPEGWKRPLARGWVMFGFMLLAGVAVTLAGIGMLVSAQGADRLVAGAVVLFGLACAIGSSLFRPAGRRGGTRLRLETVDLGDRHELGVAFPYSRLRMAAAFLVGGVMALALVGLGLGELFSDNPDESTEGAWLAAAGGLILLAVVFLGARKGMGRHWRVVLTPSAVVFDQGRDQSVVPWDAVDEVNATEITTYTRGFPIHEPYIGIVVGDRDAVRTGKIMRAFMGVNRALGGDISLPVRPLAADPVLLYATLRHYHRSPRARDELGTEAALHHEGDRQGSQQARRSPR